MLELILSVIITCFFVLMIVFIIVAIIQGIYYIIYQRSNRVHLSFRAYCYMDCSFFSLHYKGKQIDTILIYSKYKGSFYALGLNGIYKFGKGKCHVLIESDIEESEALLIEGMKETAKAKLGKYGDLIQAFSNQYGILIDNELQ